MLLGLLLLAVAVAYLAAVAFYPALTLGRWPRAGVLAALYVPVLASPLLVPADAPFVRFLAAVNAVVLLTKLWDLHVAAGLGQRPRLRAFLAFLPNLMSAVLRKLGDEPRPGRRKDLLRLGLGVVGVAVGVAVLFGVFQVDWSGRPFLVEHVVKVVTFYLALIPGTVAGMALWRLAGGAGREHFNHPFLARTPADFWRRYNRPAAQFFYEDLFKPAGGLRAPIRATLLTFVVSAVVHEYLFDIAVGRVEGYQTAFFLLQGAAVAATVRVRPRGWRAMLWVAGTLAFTLLTSVLFFASVNGLLRFYSRGLPGWLSAG